MKKRFLSLLMVFCLMLSLAPAAFAVDEPVTTEAALTSALSSATAGDKITLGADITLTTPLTIGKAVTIDGTAEKYAITYDGTDTEYAITINAGVTGVTLKNLNITAPNGVNVLATGATIDNCNINAYRRGINFYLEGTNSGATLDVNNCNILNTRAEDASGVYYSIDNRGIATGNITNGTINITGGEISGFKYSINPVIDPVNGLRDGDGTEFNVTGTTVWGWTALNIWSANTTYTFTDCTLVGVNKFDDATSSNDYATIMANDNICGGDSDYAPVVEIVGGEIAAVRYGASQQTAVYVDANCFTAVNFSKDENQNNVIMSLYGTATYQAAAFMFSYTVSDTDVNNYVESSGYYDNVDATNYQIVSETTTAISTADTNSLNLNDPAEQTTMLHCGGDLA